jgi:NAD-dependent dihydropyrimidine dehydrogenase PreA subunit
MDFLNMNADDVTAYVNAKWPDANKSPLAKLFDTAEVADEVIDVSDDDISEAVEHAHSCIDACKANGIEFDEETISHNVKSNFPHLDEDTCDAVASVVVGDRL